MFMHQAIVIDDFYPDPDAIHDIVYSMPVEEKSSGNYSGVMTKDSFFTKEHQDVFQYITGDRLVPCTGLSGKIRFSLESDKASQHIHFDPGANSVWAGVCYLQKPEHYDADNEYGTIMWKHKKTGLSSIPMSQEGIEKHGWKGVEDLKVFLETDGMDESLWDKTLAVPYRYNRLVLFRPWMFHSPGKNFGNSKENCRVLQTFFLGLE
jgi:hypothetical protein